MTIDITKMSNSRIAVLDNVVEKGVTQSLTNHAGDIVVICDTKLPILFAQAIASIYNAALSKIRSSSAPSCRYASKDGKVHLHHFPSFQDSYP